MKISLNWLSEYIDIAPMKKDLGGVLEQLTKRGLEVENVTSLSKGFEKVFVAVVKEKAKHPNADRLSVCQLDDGKEIRQIVCGAQNFKQGDKVCMSIPGAVLPNGMEIKKGMIRDVESGGMLCSESELGMAAESEGILILPADAPLGAPVADVLGRDDVVFEINVTPNRGDALSHIGVARELASILGQTVKLPLGAGLKEESAKSSDKISVKLDSFVSSKNLCSQYHGRFIDGVKVAPSPAWMQKRLTAIGLRPINNIVDITNYVLMEYGTPLHAFDAAKLAQNSGKIEITVRQAKTGEKLPLLDKTEVTLTDKDMVIADATKAVALAGVMGGGNSEVSDSTTTLLLEAAQFDASQIRATAKRHSKKSDSSFRYERQIDFLVVATASKRAAQLIAEIAGGKVSAGTASVFSSEGEKSKSEIEKSGFAKVLNISLNRLSKFLGTEISEKDFIDSLKKIGFGVNGSADKFTVSVPSNRPDVTIAEDIYEEVLRVWGYDKVPEKVPLMQFIPDPLTGADARAKQILKIKEAFVARGFNETMNYAFTSKALNDKWGNTDAAVAVTLANPLNEDFSTMKTSLISGLISNYLTAIHNQISGVRFFEVRPVYFKDASSDTGVREEWRVSALVSGPANIDKLQASDRNADFYDVKGVFEGVLEAAGTKGLRYEVPADAAALKDDRLHPGQAVKIVLGRGACGVMGRLHPRLEAEMKSRTPVYFFECDLERVLELSKAEKKYSPISKFPKMARDYSLIAPDSLSAEKVLNTVMKYGKPLLESAQIIDLYRGEKIEKGMYSLTVATVYGDQNRTLEEKEVESTSVKILGGLEKDLAVKLRLQ